MTLFAGRPILLSFLLMLPALALLSAPKQEGPSPLPSKQPPTPTGIPRVKLPPLPALTTYRAHMMLMTILAILAVDFPVFPRYLAKCETFGVSLMDLGVGSFVFSQGVVSAIPLIRDENYLTAPLLPKVVRVTRKCIPVIVLGLVRVLLVKGTEYPVRMPSFLFSVCAGLIRRGRNTLQNTEFTGTSSSPSHSFLYSKFCYIQSLFTCLSRS